MARHLTLSQMTFLVGVALGVAAISVLIIYLIHRSLREYRKGLEFKPSTPHAENESAFIAATVQSLIAELKSRSDDLEKRWRHAERRARASAKSLEAVARTIPQGLLVVSAEGYLTLINAPARRLLQLDVWSHRRLSELLGDSPLSEAIAECLASGNPQSLEKIEYATPSGRLITLGLRIEPIQGQDGTTEGAVGLLWQP